MVNSKGNPGVSKLARAIDERIRLHREDEDAALEFGKIQRDNSLMTNGFPKSIPKGSYFILQHGDDVAGPGDSVLVAWVGSVPVVLGVAVSSKSV